MQVLIRTFSGMQQRAPAAAAEPQAFSVSTEGYDSTPAIPAPLA